MSCAHGWWSGEIRSLYPVARLHLLDRLVPVLVPAVSSSARVRCPGVRSPEVMCPGVR